MLKITCACHKVYVDSRAVYYLNLIKTRKNTYTHSAHTQKSFTYAQACTHTNAKIITQTNTHKSSSHPLPVNVIGVFGRWELRPNNGDLPYLRSQPSAQPILHRLLFLLFPFPYIPQPISLPNS